MDAFADAWQMLLRLDLVLEEATAHLGAWTYAMIFLTVFVETGFVVTGILPSGTLLFAAAALAARGSLTLWPLFVGGTAAAFCGDQLNFGWGVLARKRLAGRGLPRGVKAGQLEAARRAFARYGPMAIVLARFVPMLRSVAPLAAGLAGMPGRTFAGYNLCGKLPWTALHVCGGYFLGSIPWFARHFAAVILAAALFPFAIAAIRALVLHFAAKRSAR
ncbi:MAG: DedA family protein [Solidesulfovibrio sp. DCME]|uniref:DedA family protein n=1 Tax=Solidesulfovibrio sp. DCME TaxID=3447380 RepID=UPI003D0BD8B8